MLIFWWVFLSAIVGYLASKKGRDVGRWFVIALITSPLIAGICLLISNDITEQEALKDGELKKCGMCAELIKKDAQKCKFCGENCK
jgi:hypothetical protein